MKKMPRLAATVLLLVALLVPAVHVTANPDSPTATPTWMDLLASRCLDWLSVGPSRLSAGSEAPPTDFSPEPGAAPGDTTLTTTPEPSSPEGDAAPSADPNG